MLGSKGGSEEARNLGSKYTTLEIVSLDLSFTRLFAEMNRVFAILGLYSSQNGLFQSQTATRFSNRTTMLLYWTAGVMDVRIII